MRRPFSRPGSNPSAAQPAEPATAGQDEALATENTPSTTGLPPAAVTEPQPVALWAPDATTSVELILQATSHPDLPAEQPPDQRIALHRGEHGWWHGDLVIPSGHRYGFSLDGGPVRADPRSPRQPDGPHQLSQAYHPGDFTWTDQGWPGLALPGAVLYELHIGTFTPQGTLDAAIEHLGHIVDLGVDAICLMPVATFPGRHGWGYDGVGLWAVHEPYGGPEALQRFVDACHARGLGVVLDVVYNHLGPDGNYLADFGPYFTDRYGTPWGSAVNLDGPDSDEVRAFFLDNASFWLRDFHLDGLRLDAVHELHDERAVTFLEDLAVRVDELREQSGRSLWAIAESDRNDPKTVLRREEGGLGLDAQWADDVHHGLHVALTGETQGYYGDFAESDALGAVLAEPYFHAGTWSSFRGRTHGRHFDPERIPGWRFVTFLQNHDQVGNRRAGDRHAVTVNTRRLCCGATLLLTGPYTPMLFMGEEWGALTPWQFFTAHTDPVLADQVRAGRRAEFASHGWAPESVPDPQDPATFEGSKLDWSEPDREPHSTVLGWYRALLALRRSRSDLRDEDLAAVVVRHNPDTGAVLVHRGDHRVAVNLGTEPVRVPLDLPDGTRCVVLLTLDPIANVDEDGSVILAPDSAIIVGPTNPRRD